MNDKLNCEKCGEPLEPGEKFCRYCGNPVNNNFEENNSNIAKFGMIGIIILVAIIALILGLRGNSSPESSVDSNNENVTDENDNFPSNVTVYNGHHYAVYDYTEEGLSNSFDAWERFCENQGGHLAVIGDEEENEAIYDYLQSQGLTLAFFGYTDEDYEGDWTWVNGENSTYTNWAYGQPNNGANNSDDEDENYAQFYKEAANGTWNDSKIGVNSYKFICEWDY